MRKLVWSAAALVIVVVGTRTVLRPGTHGRALLRRSGDRTAREVRHLATRWQGVSYRMRGRHPDPTVSGGVLADRIRSSLGPLESRLDLPHIHVMVEDHTALLHGDVATAAQAAQIEQAVAAVSGVAVVDSHLHVGLLPSDTRPSDGVRHGQPSEAFRRLVGAAVRAGLDERDASAALRSVLGAFIERLPESERRQVTSHLPADVRRLTAAPPPDDATPPPRTVADLVARVQAIDGLADDAVEPVITAVLGTLRELVPEEAADVTAVLPQELKRLWQEAGGP